MTLSCSELALEASQQRDFVEGALDVVEQLDWEFLEQPHGKQLLQRLGAEFEFQPFLQFVLGVVELQFIELIQFLKQRLVEQQFQLVFEQLVRLEFLFQQFQLFLVQQPFVEQFVLLVQFLLLLKLIFVQQQFVLIFAPYPNSLQLRLRLPAV